MYRQTFFDRPLVSKEGYRYERTLSRSGEGENSISYNTSVMVLKDEGTDFDGVVLIRTEAMHGESPDQAAGPVCGIILQAAEEPVLYVAGDTVYYKGVEQALEQYRPDVVVLNACGAELMGLGRLIMGDEDVLKVCEAINDPAARLLSLLFCMAK